MVARVVAESSAGARRLLFGAQASASVRENVRADHISHNSKYKVGVLFILYIHCTENNESNNIIWQVIKIFSFFCF